MGTWARAAPPPRIYEIKTAHFQDFKIIHAARHRVRGVFHVGYAMPDAPSDTARSNAAFKAGERAACKEAFLCALFGGATVAEAATLCDVSRSTVYRWRMSDRHFASLWRAQEDAGDDPVEVEAIRRALMGTKKPVYRGGTLVGEVTEKSDSLLMFLLKSRQPEKYGTARDAKPDSAGTEDDKLKGARHALFSKLCALARPPQAG